MNHQNVKGFRVGGVQDYKPNRDSYKTEAVAP